MRVLTDNERTIEVPIRLEVLSAQGLLVATINIFGGDSPHVQVTSGKAYSLRVSGAGIETVTTPLFEISPMEGEHTETVHVKPSSQKQAGDPTPGSPTISVSEMNIPKKASAEMKKGLDAYSKGDMENAAAHFEKAAAEYPRYARAYDMLGAVAIKELDRSKARDLFLKSIQMDSSFYPAYVDLARMDVQDQRYAEAESLLEKAIALNPFTPDAVALLATAEFANREYDKALADVERTHALPNHEQFAEVHIMAGKVLKMQNQPDAAISQFQLFLKEKPQSPEAESVRNAIASIGAGQQH
ncbi:MAG: tetratricopeptide repeat protein [Silvibacterium sp.]|nr:tetratricopeptide repeat protein [Silvibacterium sp.]